MNSFFIRSFPIAFIMCFVISGSLMAQDIPNRDFESWKKEKGLDEPAGWNTRNEPGFSPVVSTKGLSGKKAVKLLVLKDEILKKNGGGSLSTTFAIVPGEKIRGIGGFYKGLSMGNDSLIIDVSVVLNEMEISSGSFRTGESTDEWKPFLIDLSNGDSQNHMTCRILIHLEPGDTGRGGGYFCIDKMELKRETD